MFPHLLICFHEANKNISNIQLKYVHQMLFKSRKKWHQKNHTEFSENEFILCLHGIFCIKKLSLVGCYVVVCRLSNWTNRTWYDTTAAIIWNMNVENLTNKKIHLITQCTQTVWNNVQSIENNPHDTDVFEWLICCKNCWSWKRNYDFFFWINFILSELTPILLDLTSTYSMVNSMLCWGYD